jgi:hypothetical protein
MRSLFDDSDPPQWLRWSLRLLALGIGALHTLVAMRSQSMNEDGIAYLDLGRAWLQHDWDAVINSTWGPLYAWILGGAVELAEPSLQSEFPLVQAVNFLIFCVALVTFEFFWTQLTRAYRAVDADRDEASRFPPSIWLAVGYSLFTWVSLNLIAVWAVTPDMCVAALYFTASGLFLKISHGGTRATALLMGLALALAYLAKPVTFPIALALLALAALVPARADWRMRRAGVALAGFLIIAAPTVIAASVITGHPTFGDAGRFAYLKHVNGLHWPQWQETEGLAGTPLHAPRRVHSNPSAWEFATPIRGTYPLGYDPAWWTQGIDRTIALRPQLQAIVDNAVYYFDLFLRQQAGIIALVALLGALAWPQLRRTIRFERALALSAWSVFALAYYGLVYAESRYVAPFVLFLWAGLLAHIRLPAGEWQRRTLSACGVLLALFFWVNIAALNLEGFGNLIGYASQRHGQQPVTATTTQILETGAAADHPAIAKALLTRYGLEANAPVAFVGYSYYAYWARLARLRIIAEVRPEEFERFWTADARVRDAVLAQFAAAGARVVVSEPVRADSVRDWDRLGETGYLARRLR